MKNPGFKITLLVFFIALLSGFYIRLPLADNLIRSFVLYLIFSIIYLGGITLFNQLTLDSLKNKGKKPVQKSQENLKQATPNIAK
jgi:hypothetical protein